MTARPATSVLPLGTLGPRNVTSARAPATTPPGFATLPQPAGTQNFSTARGSCVNG
jgi:hypothetical protein